VRCFIDSNIIISAGLFPKSTPATALEKAMTPPNVAIVSDYSLDETRRVINKKFPDKVTDLELFLFRTLFSVQLVSTPIDDIKDESKVRDIDDRPILRAATEANADVLITGDKDLLDSGVTHPRIITAAEFVDMH
jgi:putative PIN family toxin of toxin-antitoxin system